MVGLAGPGRTVAQVLAGLGRVWLLALCWLACGGADAAAAGAQPGAVVFEQMEAARADWDSARPPQDGWVPVALPDLWHERWPRFEGVVWYRLRWQQEAASEPLSLMIDAVSMAGAIYVNGALLARDHHLVEPLSRSWNRSRHWLLPADLLRTGTNEIWLRVSGMAVHHAGLGPVRLSRSPAEAARYERDETMRRALLILGVGVALATAVVFGVIWLLRPKERLYGCFALFSLLRLPAAYNYIATEAWPYASTAAFQFAILASLVASATCFLIFALLFGGYAARRSKCLAVALCVLVIGAMALQAPGLGAVGRIAVVLAGGFFLWGSGVVIWHAVRTRRAAAVAFALCLLLPMAAAARDVLVFNRVLQSNTYVFPAASSLLLIGIACVLALHLVHGMRVVENFNAELRERVDEAKARLAQALRSQHRAELEQARLNERLSLVRDLHDGLGMSLSSHIHALQGRPGGSDRAALWTLRDINNDLRLLIEGASLDDTDVLMERLAPLRHRSTRLLDAAGIHCSWELMGLQGLRMGARRSLDLLRLLQEALTNVLKHSTATRVVVRVEAADGKMSLSVTDNGRGMGTVGDAVQPAETVGMGLASMHARAQRLGGALRIQSGAQGTALTLQIPVSG
ncbi:ATP-binding protein [Xenophilus sp. Marseille-Q4582]|uniref:sensor histidine kinase n=1 Tax=Xenophilus sp. Marseille-Q4582 TaxID=2866600 RepID=UPI001CE3F0EE|nr:ATP-binding protein [Xenophilus sp. Marseille-Q4582]